MGLSFVMLYHLNKEGFTHEEKTRNKEGYSSKSGLSGIDKHCRGVVPGLELPDRGGLFNVCTIRLWCNTVDTNVHESLYYKCMSGMTACFAPLSRLTIRRLSIRESVWTILSGRGFLSNSFDAPAITPRFTTESSSVQTSILM